ncbi:MAG: 2-C-methyl-D-erythritol 4-phosphate cytidylyltransferase [Waddliaceae bacterium]
MPGDVSIILLAGGNGSRFNSKVPKQFLPLGGQPIVHYSYRLFVRCPEAAEIIVVCAPEYQELFHTMPAPVPLQFALPGKRRQDSLRNGLEAVQAQSKWICVHDSARPFITKPLLNRLFSAARKHGAATAGLPVKSTIKQADADHLVCQTPDRSSLWEIQTPQIIRTDWLKEGFAHIDKHQLTVTDDVSIVEKLELPVKIVKGEEGNVKITTQQDFFLAENMLENQQKNIQWLDR